MSQEAQASEEKPVHQFNRGSLDVNGLHNQEGIGMESPEVKLHELLGKEFQTWQSAPATPCHKKRKIFERDSRSPDWDTPTALLPISSPKPAPVIKQYNQPLVNKVVWVDIAVDETQTYWWPGVLSYIGSLPHVTLIADSKKEFKHPKPKLLSSFKATKPFLPEFGFQPDQINPIFLQPKADRSQYPTKKALQKAFALAREKYLIYTIEEKEDLPDVSACMIQLSQESREALAAAVLSQDDTSRDSTSSNSEEEEQQTLDAQKDSLDDIFDQPDAELQIPGEVILSKMKPKSDYWPAQVIEYAGLKPLHRRGFKKRIPLKEKYYRIEFCDQEILDVPRSFFLTTDQEEFYQVEVGKLSTIDVSFEDLIPEIEEQVHLLDLVIQGRSADPILMKKHKNFLENPKTRGRIPNDVKYGKYCEDVLQKVGEYIKERYLSSTSINYHLDGQFLKLSESEKTQYIFDILVPELIWLITVQQYASDAKEELPENASTEEIWEYAQKAAAEDIQEADLVDKVMGLRIRKKAMGDQEDEKAKCIERKTSNSQRKTQA
ncbi:hypothetical protein O181_085420 [Austropuccinia psidii MF-1]|uniref:PWWP domain-containing protein n=1 Tax=Austropuccinia psidii MF-1 TaxID=1389203 RepID=A0A9Q3FXI2_9BASI|nr:hypothetical protein [Austropuccinia psidii MF-1]